MDIAGQNDLIAALAGGQHHALHRAGRAADHQKGIRRTEGLGGQLLGLPDDRYRVAEVIQRLHAVDIHPNTLLTKEGGQLGVTAATLVPGNIKGDNAHFSERFQCLVDRRTALIQTGTLRISVHFSLRPRFLCKQKSASHAQMYRLALKFSMFCTGRNTPGLAPREHFYRMIQKG